MKKVFSIILVLVIVFAFTTISVSAETKKSDWKKANGNAEIGFNSEGTEIFINEGFSYYYYKNKVNIRDFTVKIKLKAPIYDDSWGYFVMTIGGTGVYIDRENAQNFVQLIPKSENSLQVDSQILHAAKGGIFHYPTYVDANIVSNDLIIQGKKVDENNYQLIFNNGAGVCKYNIPIDNNFVEDVNGVGCLGFGAVVNPGKIDDKTASIVVKEINGVAMNVKDAVTSSSPTTSTNNTSSDKTDSTTSDTSSDKNNSTTTNINSDVTNDDGSGTTDAVTNEVVNETKENSSKSKKQNKNNIPQNNNIIIIVIGALLLITNIIIFSILLVRKKQTKAFVENGEDLEELQE